MCFTAFLLGYLTYAIVDYFTGHWRVALAKDKDGHWCVIVFNIDKVAPRRTNRFN